MAENLLEVRHLKTYFKIGGGFGKKAEYLRAVDDVSFTLKKGETLGIVGESGCGKSTLGNTIIRLLEPTDGEILFEGKNIVKMSKRELARLRPNIQMIFQDPFSSLDPHMRVFDIIAEPLRAHHVMHGKELEDRVMELMHVVGLDPSYAKRFPHEFSGGQRQRIGIARALALRPKLVICDEPVSALDVSIQAQILNLIYELQEKFDLTYIFIAHGLPSVKHISSKVAVMYLGKIVELADRDDLFSHPMHPYTHGLFEAIPIPDPKFRSQEDNREILSGDIPNALHPPKGCYFHPRCPYATEECKCNTPEFRELEPNHFVACHHPLACGQGTLKE
ncbi:ABC transporter ATP-binding protein [uncultured Ruthenibacterium sp.]|uniref:ABC transporter ATP-binding protein n=1 Tax=uncultured Ruthenibacterium sp. TaxID=1905347 RepID=UPI00349E610F